MSEWDVEDSTEESTPNPGPAQLRQAYEKQKQQSKELADQLADLQKKVRESEVRAKLSAAGLPEKAVGLFPRDLDPTDEAVTKWIGDYGSLFSVPNGGTITPPVEPAGDTQTPAPPVDQKGLEEIQKVTTGGTPGDAKSSFQQMLDNPRLVDEVPFEDFLSALKSMQGGS